MTTAQVDNDRSMRQPNQSELGSHTPIGFWEQEVPGSNPGAPMGLTPCLGSLELQELPSLL